MFMNVVCVYMYIYISIHMYTYSYAKHTHTHTHTHTQASNSSAATRASGGSAPRGLLDSRNKNSPAPPAAVPDGFAIQLDKLHHGPKVLKEVGRHNTPRVNAITRLECVL